VIYPIIHTALNISILTLVVGMLFSCSNTEKELHKFAFTDNFPDEQTKDVTIYYSDSAKIKMKLVSPLMERYTKSSGDFTEFKDGLEVFFYSDSGTLDNFVRANYAKHLTEEKKMIAKHDVVAKNNLGDMLNTEHLVWDQEKQLFYSDEFVKITTKDEIIYGDGFEANEDFSKYKIKNIKGIIAVDDTQEE
jgi:LPS export ABC transporter protein LptC